MIIFQGFANFDISNAEKLMEHVPASNQESPFKKFEFNASTNGEENFLYVAYPKSAGKPSKTQFGGFGEDFTAYEVKEVEISVTPEKKETFLMFKSQNKYNGNNLTWEFFKG